MNAQEIIEMACHGVTDKTEKLAALDDNQWLSACGVKDTDQEQVEIARDLINKSK